MTERYIEGYTVPKARVHSTERETVLLRCWSLSTGPGNWKLLRISTLYEGKTMTERYI